MSINELYEKIDELNKKIEEEPKKRRKRRRNIEFQINELKDERTRFGLKKDFSSVEKINFQIWDLEHKKNRDCVSRFKREIKNYQEKIVDIIIDYYKNNKMIEDIIKIEDIPQNIYEKWFELSDFGEKSGYLFVECVTDDDCNWLYSNPINEVKFNSIHLDELKDKADENREILFIFNNDLSDKSSKRDLTICQNIIDEELNNITDNYLENYEIFEKLGNFSDKFNKNQINQICDLFIENLFISDFRYEVIPILNVNKDKVRVDFYSIIIDNHIKKLNNPYLKYSHEEKIFKDFKLLADKFSENQIYDLSNLFMSDYSSSEYLNVLNYILDVNKNKFNNNFDDIYNNIVENSLNRLYESDLNNYLLSNLFKNLKFYSKKISEEQLNQLCEIIINNCEISGYFAEFNHILCENQYDFDYKTFINNRIQFLKDIDSVFNIKNIMLDLKIIKNHFGKIQLNELCNILVLKTNLYNFGSSFNKILDYYEDEIEDINSIYSDIIDGRIEKLNQTSSDSYLNALFNVLDSYSREFTKYNLELFCSIIKDNNLISYLRKHMFILQSNQRRFGDEIDNEISGLIIDCKLDELDKLRFGYTDARDILRYLAYYYNNFTEEQLDKLCNIAINNSQVYRAYICRDSLRYILNKNKYLINPVLYDQVAFKNGF